MVLIGLFFVIRIILVLGFGGLMFMYIKLVLVVWVKIGGIFLVLLRLILLMFNVFNICGFVGNFIQEIFDFG